MMNKLKAKPKARTKAKPKKDIGKELPMFCGITPVPKGKRRGTPQYCAAAKQIRYYGLVAIDPKLLGKKPPSLSEIATREIISHRKLLNQAQILVKKAQQLKLIINDPKSSAKKRNTAQKAFDILLTKREPLKKKIHNQEITMNLAIAAEKKFKAKKVPVKKAPIKKIPVKKVPVKKAIVRKPLVRRK